MTRSQLAGFDPIPEDKTRESLEWRGSGTILVVDDEEGVRNVLRNLLEEAGLTVLTASSGGEAADLFRSRPDEIDLVLLDLTMPGMDGRETYLALRSIRADVRVVLLSGYSKDVASRRFLGLGLMGFVHKPFEEATLLGTVRTLLGV